MWQKQLTREALETIYKHWLEHSCCPRCGHDHIFIRRMANSKHRGHSYHPYCERPYYWKFTCQECKAQWVSMSRFKSEIAENS